MLQGNYEHGNQVRSASKAFSALIRAIAAAKELTPSLDTIDPQSRQRFDDVAQNAFVHFSGINQSLVSK